MADSLTEDDIARIAQQEGVDPRYALAIVKKEGSGDSDVSGAGAVGRFQILPDTFKAKNPQGDINNPEDNAIAGIRYLKEGLDKNGGDFQKAAAYYYAGPGWQQKIARAPNQKYGGTKPDPNNPGKTLDGISIEDYAKQASAHVTGSQTGPGMDGLMGDVDSAIANLSYAADKQLETIGATQQALNQRIKDNLQQQVDATTRGGELKATIELDKFRQQQQRAGENAAVLSKFGINTSDINNVVAQISSELGDDYETAQAMRADIDEKRSVGFFESPIQYLVNQFTLNADIRRHNAIIQRMNSKKAFVDQATSMVAELQGVNAAKFVPMSLEGASAAAEVERNKAQVDALKIQDSLMKQDFDTQVKTLGVIQSRINNINALTQAQLNSQIKRDAAQRKADEDERARMDDSQVLTASRMIGMEVPTRKALEKMPQDTRKAIEYIMSNGGVIGKDPLEALQVLKRGNPQAMPMATKYHMDTLEAAYQQAYGIVKKKPELQTAKPQQVQEAISGEMNSILNRAANDPNLPIRPSFNGVPDNPYHIPNFNTMKGIPESRSLPISKILDTHIKNFPNKPVPDQLMLELAYENVGEGKAYPNVITAARDLSTYYKTGVDYNNQKMRFTNVGLPEQASYNVGKVDMMKYDSVLKYFLQKQRQEHMDPDFGRFARPGEPFRTVAEKAKIAENPKSKPAFSKAQAKAEASAPDSDFTGEGGEKTNDGDE